MDAPAANRERDQRGARRPLEHVDGLHGSSVLVVVLVRLLLRSVVLGSRASMNVATYLDTLVERVAETYLQTGVNILDNDLPVRLNDADAIIDVHPAASDPSRSSQQPGARCRHLLQFLSVWCTNRLWLRFKRSNSTHRLWPSFHLVLLPPPPPPPPAYGALEDAPLGGPVAGAPAPGLGDQHLGTRYLRSVRGKASWRFR